MTPWREEESVRVSFTANCFVRATRCRKLMPKWRKDLTRISHAICASGFAGAGHTRAAQQRSPNPVPGFDPR